MRSPDRACHGKQPHATRAAATAAMRALAQNRGTILDNAWTVEDGKPYCPRHNPADNGAIIEVKHGDDYQPIGTSGWEIRLPRDGSPIGWFKVEVRQTRKDGAEIKE